MKPHEGHRLKPGDKVAIDFNDPEARKATILASQKAKLNVTNFIRKLIADELGIEFDPPMGLTPVRGDGKSLQLNLGREWKARLSEIRQTTGKSLPQWVKEKIGYQAEPWEPRKPEVAETLFGLGPGAKPQTTKKEEN